MYSYINPVLYETARYDLPGLNHTKSTNSFINDKHFTKQTQIKKKMDKGIIAINKKQLDKYVEIYNWRAKTQLPIAKIISYKILNKSAILGLQQKITVEITYEAPIKKLSELEKLPLFQIMYIMKQTLIGCQRLFNKFGVFKVSKEMIFLNKNHKCKVWMNENFMQNKPQQELKARIQTQKQQELEKKISRSIYLLFQVNCFKSKQSTQFFDRILQIQRLVQAIKFIQSFAKQKKINISNSLKLNDSLTSHLSKNPLFISKISTANTSWINNSVQYSQINGNYNNNNHNNFNFNFNEYTEREGMMTCSNGMDMDSPNGMSSSSGIPSIPRFLKKQSDLNKSTYTPPQFLKNHDGKLTSSKSSNNIKAVNLKHSTLTRFVKKDTVDLSKSSYDGSVSQTHSMTPKSTNTFDKVKAMTPRLDDPSTPTKSFDEVGLKKQITTSSFRLLKKKTFQESAFQKMEKQFQNCSNDKQKQRKFSNQFDPKVLHQFKGIKINSSPQLQQKFSIQSPYSPIPAIKILNCIQQKNPQVSCNFQKLFEKNGWKFQLSSLIQNDISIRQSIRDGIQQRSATLGTTLDFAKLARLGRAIKGSMVPDDEKINNSTNF